MTAATLTRELRFEAPPIDTAPDALIPCTIATSAPVVRWGVVEVLDCSPAGVDLSRAPLPLIVAHDTGRLSIGLVENLAATGDHVTGEVRFGTSPEAQQVRADVVAGIHRSLSVGYSLLDQGSPVEGGLRFRWQPHEVSIVPVPADPAAGFFRSLHAPNIMTTTTTTTRAADQITELCARHKLPELGTALIQRGATLEQANRAVLDELAARDRAAGGHLNVTGHHTAASREASLIVETLVQRMGGKAQGETIRNTDLTGLAVRALQASGHRVSDSDSRDRIFERALSVRAGMMGTSDFPHLLGTAVGRVLHDAYTAAPAALKAVARLNNAPDFRARTVARMGTAPNLEKVNEHGEFKYGAVNDFGNTWSLATYGKIIGLSRQAMVNDDLNAFATLLRKFGEAAARREADELVSILVTPGNVDDAALFSTGRNSLLTSSALSLNNLAAAVGALRVQTEDGQLVSQEPGALIVPAALEATARQLMSGYNPNSAANANPYGALSIVVEPRLDASSTTTWYLAAANQSSLEYGYLDGAEGVQTFQEEGFEVDGLQIKARLDFGCGWVAPVGWVKATA
jgi:hypothetical protein